MEKGQLGNQSRHSREATSARSGRGLRGLFGRPFLDLEPHLNLEGLDEVTDEIAVALTRVDPGFSGATLRYIGWSAPDPNDRTIDVGEVVDGFSPAELETFISLGSHERLKRHRADPSKALNRQQMLYLKYRYGVFYPWSVAYDMIARDSAPEDAGRWTSEARAHFPRTIAMIERLPLTDIRYSTIYGLDAYVPGPTHRDCATDEEPATPPNQFILLVPRGNKRGYLYNPDSEQRTYLDSRAYWFNDRDYHGVAPDPYFRYSLQVDGTFDPEFLARALD